jgi:hypothetical protein
MEMWIETWTAAIEEVVGVMDLLAYQPIIT